MAERQNGTDRARRLKHAALPWLLPRLVEIERDAWDDVLGRLRETPFDTFEYAGLLLGLAFVTYLLGADSTLAAERTLPAVWNMLTGQFLAAAPLLALLAGPLYLRCWRRGLDHEIERRRQGQPPLPTDHPTA